MKISKCRYLDMPGIGWYIYYGEDGFIKFFNGENHGLGHLFDTVKRINNMYLNYGNLVFTCWRLNNEHSVEEYEEDWFLFIEGLL